LQHFCFKKPLYYNFAIGMFKKLFIILPITFFVVREIKAQCTTLGQNPSTAFPVCGTTVFNQVTVPICSSSPLFVPGCTGSTNANYENKNPFWYKFTCYTSGTLGFTITPADLGDDYDWQLYDITGRNPDEVYTNRSLVVTGNWSGSSGLTGASSSGVNYIQCASRPRDNAPRFSAMPNLIAGHEYILLVSHYTDSQSGYGLSFGGGTAVITDPKEPHLESARAICDGTQAAIKFNKRMKCNSLSTDGSEFFITSSISNVIVARGFGCSTGFDMDSLILTLDAPLPPGNYKITIKNGIDGNTIKDNCDRTIPVNETIPLVVYPVFPTPMDSLSKVFCAPDELQLVFRKNIRCSSIAPDGSDFKVNLISGTATVSVVGASGNCNADGLSLIIKVKLSAPIQTKGVYQIQLQTGSDGNIIIDECGQETPAGATINFSTKDTVNADFTYNIRFGCKRDTIDYFHDRRNEVDFWKWNFDNNRSSSLQNPSIVYATFGQKTAQLIVSNGVCADSSAVVPIFLDNYLKATFEATEVVCPGDLAVFKDTSVGKIVLWNWDFGNGSNSALQQPPPQAYQYFNNGVRDVLTKLIVTNNIGCLDTAKQIVKVAGNCYIAVPNAFTPNNDGLNDYLYPLNAYKATNLIFKVCNRFGQVLFSTTNWTVKWDGTFKGQGADPGTYVWILQYTNKDTGKRVEQKGATILIR
jgi:gliding motility-associated-like protein